MLSLLPIQFLSLFGYFILRVTIGLILVYVGVQHWQYRHELTHVLRSRWWPYGGTMTYLLIVVELVLAGLLLLGAWTQAATITLAAMSSYFILFRKYIHHHTIPSQLFYCLLLGASITLTITGAGAPAIDLPL